MEVVSLTLAQEVIFGSKKKGMTHNEQGLALLGDLKNVRPEPLLMLC